MKENSGKIFYKLYCAFNLPQFSWTNKLVTDTSYQNRSLLNLLPKIYNLLKDLSDEKD